MAVLDILQSYSFDVYPSSVIGSGFQNCTVLALMDHSSAAAEIDTVALHAQVYPYLPKGYIDDPTQYTYVKVKLASGDITIIGLPWINNETIKKVSATTIRANIRNVTPDDLDKLRRVLLSNGYEHVTLEVVS